MSIKDESLDGRRPGCRPADRPVHAREEPEPASPHLFSSVRRRAVWTDALVLAAVPVALVVVYGLPPETKWAFAFDYTAPTVLTAYTGHFVHMSGWHLLVNLLGYLLVVPTAFVLSVAGGRRRQFWIVFTVFVLAFPLTLSAMNLLVPRDSVAIGFSGLVMAFVGFLPVAITSLTGRRAAGALDQRRSHWMFFVGVAIVGYLAVPGITGAALAVAAFLAGVLFVLPVIEAADRWEEITRFRSSDGYAELTLLGGVIFVGYPFVAFPSDVVVGGGVVNLYTHAIGFCLGYIVTYVTMLAGGFQH